MMNTLESFLAPARVSDWMACAHVRRCPNWQCWWDEDSVVAASGLTEDDERNLQADKMRSKARARKLAKSRCSFLLPSQRFEPPAPKLLRCFLLNTPRCVPTRPMCPCHLSYRKKRGGGDPLSRVYSSAKNASRSGRDVSSPRAHRSRFRWFPAAQSFMCDEKRCWCFAWLRSWRGRNKHRRPRIRARAW